MNVKWFCPTRDKGDVNVADCIVFIQYTKLARGVPWACIQIERNRWNLGRKI